MNKEKFDIDIIVSDEKYEQYCKEMDAAWELITPELTQAMQSLADKIEADFNKEADNE